MQRTVVHANFHWKLVQRYELFLKVARILEEKIFIPTLFSNFSPFSFFISILFITFANASWLKAAVY